MRVAETNERYKIIRLWVKLLNSSPGVWRRNELEKIHRLILIWFYVALPSKGFCSSQSSAQGIIGGYFPHLHFISLHLPEYCVVLQPPCCEKCLDSFLDERNYIMSSPPRKYISKLIFLLLHSCFNNGNAPTKDKEKNNTVKEHRPWRRSPSMCMSLCW